MTRTEIEYCIKLMADTNAVIDQMRGQKTLYGVNWADLRCRSVKRVEEFYGKPDDLVTTWSVRIEKAAPSAGAFHVAVLTGLIERGHVGINLTTAW
jgi:hypothetical protein